MNEMRNKILYVEDEEDIRDIVVAALENLGNYSVQACDSGKEALQVAKTFKPDLILLDVMMPGMDGPTLLRELNKIPELAQIPAIFITAKVQPHEIQSYTTMGVVDIIKKPFNVLSLTDTIKRHLQEK